MRFLLLPDFWKLGKLGSLCNAPSLSGIETKNQGPSLYHPPRWLSSPARMLATVSKLAPEELPATRNCEQTSTMDTVTREKSLRLEPQRHRLWGGAVFSAKHCFLLFYISRCSLYGISTYISASNSKSSSWVGKYSSTMLLQEKNVIYKVPKN